MNSSELLKYLTYAGIILALMAVLSLLQTNREPTAVLIVFSLFLVAFLIGSVPFGVIVGRFIFGNDLRRAGSGNIGAANALRSYGTTGGFLVLALDAAKGFIPVAVLLYGGAGELGGWAPICGFFAVLGHCYSPWLFFKGGKGVATFLGMIFALSWIAGLIFIVIWLVVVIPMRFASLGSIVASLLSPLLIWFVWHDLYMTSVTALPALLIVWKHRENISRLREGRENKIAFGKASA